MRIRFRVRTIFLLTKIHDSDLIVNTRALAQWLLGKERDVKYVIYVERQLKTNKRFDAAKLIDEVAHEYAKDGSVTEEAAREGVQRRLRYWDETMCRSRPHSFDFVITLGGDGTVLYASWLFQRIVPPVLSFALGSLGFLTKFDFEDYQPILSSAFSKGVTVSLRLRFECTIMRSVRKRLSESESDEDGDELHYRRDLVEELIGEEIEDEHTHKPEGTFEILNELVVDRGPNPSESCFLSFHLFIVYNCRFIYYLYRKSSLLIWAPFAFSSVYSHVFYGNLWRRRALYFGARRRHLRIYANRLDGL